MIRLTAGDVVLLQFQRFAAGGGIAHAVSTRLGGVSTGQFSTLNVSRSSGDDLAAVAENRCRVLTALDLDPEEIATMGQVHGDRCAVVTARPGPGGRPYVPETDALVTNVPGTPLMVLCADCAPVLLWDPEHRAVGAAHAGWRGALRGVAGSPLRTMIERYGTRPAAIRAAVGPCIGPCCFEVREHVLDPLASIAAEPERFVRRSREGHTFLDLPGLLCWQLESLGVPAESVEIAGLCTACNTDLLYSHRAERGRTGRFGAFVAVRDGRRAC